MFNCYLQSECPQHLGGDKLDELWYNLISISMSKRKGLEKT